MYDICSLAVSVVAPGVQRCRIIIVGRCRLCREVPCLNACRICRGETGKGQLATRTVSLADDNVCTSVDSEFDYIVQCKEYSSQLLVKPFGARVKKKQSKNAGDSANYSWCS
jgi:hypothetical protein